MTKGLLNYLLNGVIIILLVLVGYFGFSLINNAIKSGEGSKELADTSSSLTNQPNIAIQLDVQNGTGDNGVASVFTDYLRRNGADVVEMGNFRSNDEEKTVILDRKGDMRKARQVAKILGVNDKQIVEQINNSLYLDVTVVIGKDYKELKPYKEIRK